MLIARYAIEFAISRLTNEDDAEHDHDTGLSGGPALLATDERGDERVAGGEGVDGSHCV